jgi:hypothetical protein
VRWILGFGAAVAAVVLIGVTWNQRADELCRKDAPQTSTGYSVRWEWNEFAYVCDYRATGARPKRVGILDAFHGEDSRRHRR